VYLIAKQGQPDIIGETLVKSAALKMANIMLGKAAEAKFFSFKCHYQQQNRHKR